MTATVVAVPDIGDIADIPVIEVLVAPGDTVEEEQSLVTLESDKATMDVPAPHAGVVGKVIVATGDLVSQGSVLLELDVATGDVSSPVQGGPAAQATSPNNASTPASAMDDSRSSTQSVQPRATSSDDSRVQATRAQPSSTPVLGGHSKQTMNVTHASPTIRRFARTLGVTLSDVVGSGHKGRILRTDVESYVKTRLTQAQAGATGSLSGIAPIPAVDFARYGPIETQALSRIKRISGPFLQRAWLNVPHVTYHDEADVTELEAFRKTLIDDRGSKGVRITPLAFFMKALSAALREFPVFNSSLSPDGQALIFKKYFHIGVAVDTPNGLVVPVVRDVDTLGIIAIATALADLSARARDGKLKADEMKGGCMSISSLGGIGGTAFTPLVNAPEVAILGIARSRMTPVWNGSEFLPRLMLPLSLSFDHRVVDGAESARFMSYLCSQLSDVRKLLL